jgi:glycosyltransferase involved in cell wall biosynthesis
LIAAMKEVVAVEPSAICLIAGIGAQKAALLAQIASLGLVENVKLIGFRNDALAIIRAGDLFVLPSAAEPFGLVLIEAMSIGRPVIATRAGGPAEIIADHQTGRLVPPCEAGEMARAILTLVRDRELRRRMGEAGHLRFLERYTVDRMVRTTLDAYRKALAK